MVARWLLVGFSLATSTFVVRAARSEEGAEPAPASAQPSQSIPPAAPPPLYSQYAQYGAAINPLIVVSAGAVCGPTPCILGSGGGLLIRGGYRSEGPWYVGGGYAFAKLDSSNLLRLGVFQQVWGEMRYYFDLGFRATPYLTVGLGAVVYGNEWQAETGGATILGGAGVELEVSRLAVVGLGIAYKPTLLVGWTDSAGNARPTGLASILGLEFLLEVRTDLGRH